MNYLRCDICGKFVRYADIDIGLAIHREVMPDSEYTIETWETICPICRKQDVHPTNNPL